MLYHMQYLLHLSIHLDDTSEQITNWAHLTGPFCLAAPNLVIWAQSPAFTKSVSFTLDLPSLPCSTVARWENDFRIQRCLLHWLFVVPSFIRFLAAASLESQRGREAYSFNTWFCASEGWTFLFPQVQRWPFFSFTLFSLRENFPTGLLVMSGIETIAVFLLT